MNTSLTLLLLMVIPGMVFSQQDSAKAPVYGWKHSLVAGLTLTQVSFKDWTQGGENALAYAASIDGKSTREEPQYNWTNTYSTAFGQTRLGDQGLRKTDDKIDLESVVSYTLDEYVNPYVSATMKTQFAKGYKYDSAGNKTPVSKFFDPGYLTQAIGARYQPYPELKTRLGVALREILTSEFPSYADDPATTEVEKTRVDGGMESVTEVEWSLEENLLFTTKLELFSPFNTPDRIVARNNTTLAAKVNKYVTVNVSMQLINEPDVSPRTQIKETLALGLSYTLI